MPISSLVHPSTGQRQASPSVSIVGQPTQQSLQSQMPSPTFGLRGGNRPQTTAANRTVKKLTVELFKGKASLIQVKRISEKKNPFIKNLKKTDKCNFLPCIFLKIIF
jgi:hypothetical protein